MALIKASIDLNKIDKNKIRQGKNGQKYYDIILKDSPNDKYGNDYMVTDDQSREDRAAGKKATILGNGKNLSRGNSNASSSRSNSDGFGDLNY